MKEENFHIRRSRVFIEASALLLFVLISICLTLYVSSGGLFSAGRIAPVILVVMAGGCVLVVAIVALAVFGVFRIPMLEESFTRPAISFKSSSLETKWGRLFDLRTKGRYTCNLVLEYENLIDVFTTKYAGRNSLVVVGKRSSGNQRTGSGTGVDLVFVLDISGVGDIKQLMNRIAELKAACGIRVDADAISKHQKVMSWLKVPFSERPAGLPAIGAFILLLGFSLYMINGYIHNGFFDYGLLPFSNQVYGVTQSVKQHVVKNPIKEPVRDNGFQMPEGWEYDEADPEMSHPQAVYPEEGETLKITYTVKRPGLVSIEVNSEDKPGKYPGTFLVKKDVQEEPGTHTFEWDIKAPDGAPVTGTVEIHVYLKMSGIPEMKKVAIISRKTFYISYYLPIADKVDLIATQEGVAMLWSTDRFVWGSLQLVTADMPEPLVYEINDGPMICTLLENISSGTYIYSISVEALFGIRGTKKGTITIPDVSELRAEECP